jgi:hypothetical protein
MIAKYVRIYTVLIGLLFLALPVYADVVGTWDVTGTMQHKISVKHGKHASSTTPITDTFIFDSNNNFTATNEVLTGTWQYTNTKDTKAVVSIPDNQLITFMKTETEDQLAAAGYPSTVDNIVITKNKFTGTEKKDGTLSGKWALNFTCNVHYSGYNLPAKVKTTTKATATKETVGTASPASGEDIMSVLVEELSDQIEDALMDYEP